MICKPKVMKKSIFAGRKPLSVLKNNKCLPEKRQMTSRRGNWGQRTRSLRSAQKATAEAAATLSESTPWRMGMRTT